MLNPLKLLNHMIVVQFDACHRLPVFREDPVVTVPSSIVG
jgi:hypothetical protein